MPCSLNVFEQDIEPCTPLQAAFFVCECALNWPKDDLKSSVSSFHLLFPKSSNHFFSVPCSDRDFVYSSETPKEAGASHHLKGRCSGQCSELQR